MSVSHKIKFKPVIESLNLDGDDWALYTATMDCKQVADQLNNTFVACVNQGLDKHQTFVKMNHAFNMFQSYGAADSDPRYVLDELLRTVFGSGSPGKCGSLRAS